MSNVTGAEVQASRPLPFVVHYATVKHGAMCGKRGSDYASSSIPAVVTCKRCRKSIASQQRYREAMQSMGAA